MYPSSSDAYTAIQDFNKTRKSSANILNEANAQYGIGDLETRTKALGTTVNNLQTSIDAVDPSVTGRTSGSLVTEAQRSALINRERTPLVDQWNKANTNLGMANSDLTTARNNAQVLANSQLSDQESRYKTLQDAYSAAVAAEQAAQQKRQWETELAENTRRFNAELAQKYAEAKATAGSGYNLANYLGANSNLKTSTPTAVTSKQQNDYNFVQGLIKDVRGGNGNAASLIISQAKKGDERSKAIMRSFYQLQGKQVPKNFQSFLGTV